MEGSTQNQIGEDFFRGDTANSLSKIRNRLLDLTSRNRLLNFPFPPPKKLSLQIVDELPEILYNRLLDGDSLIFKAVPEPKSEDYSTQIKSEQQVAEPPSISIPKPTVREHAKKLGIDTSFDLPEYPIFDQEQGTIASKHKDKFLQTLQYPLELENILRSIDSAARTAIEESGTNMLYLIFGFLEWYESESSDKKRLAPLIMVPVSVKRGSPDQETGMYSYELRYSEEDVTANLSLQERLRRDFGLEAPLFTEDDTPETYFDKFKRILVSKPKWKVRRQITLTLLSFGKILMYRDLDPENWSGTNVLANHPRIREFFEGTRKEGLTFSEEYPIDEPQLKEDVPSLIYDADSSQHSALIDALKNKNLVIEGPPGTGKSQTITNLIAAALVSGKTVLFVSEKLAALEVVRRRLDEAGLGLFCLELHSHKTQKKGLLDDISQRIQAQSSFYDPKDLDQKTQLLNKDRQELLNFVELINSKYTRFLDLTIHQILWSYQRYYNELQFHSAHFGEIEEIDIRNAFELSSNDVEETKRAIELYGKNLSIINEKYTNISKHPWRGIVDKDISYQGEKDLIKALESFYDKTFTLEQTIIEFRTATSWSIKSNEQSIRDWIAVQKDFPHPIGTEIFPLLTTLTDPQSKELLISFSKSLQNYRDLSNLITSYFAEVPSLNSISINVLQDSYTKVEHLNLSALTSLEIKEIQYRVENLTSQILNAEFRALFAEVCKHLGCNIPYNIAGLKLIIVALDLLDEIPLNLLQIRHPDFEKKDSIILLQKAKKDADSLHERKEKIEKCFRIKSLPPISILNRYAVVLSNVNLFSFLKSDYREAKRTYTEITRRNNQPSNNQMAQEIRQLTEYLDDLDEFTNNYQYKTVFGLYFNGLDTRFEDIEKLINWYILVEKRLISPASIATDLTKALFSVHSDSLRTIVELKNQESTVFNNIKEFVISLSDELSTFPADISKTNTEDLLACASKLTSFASDLHAITQNLSTAGFHQNLKLAYIPVALEHLEEYWILRKDIEENHEVRRLIGPNFVGIQTDTISLDSTIALFQKINSTTLPSNIQAWLLNENVISRLQYFEEMMRKLSSQLDSFCAAYSYFASQSLDSLHIYEKLNLLQLDFSVIISRASQALAARHDLSMWLDFLRARKTVEKLQLSQIASLVEDNRITVDDLVPTFFYILYNSLIQKIFTDYPILRQFNGLNHEQIRNRFAQYDRETIKLYRARAACAIAQRSVPKGISTGLVGRYTESGLINHETRKQKRHLPIRQLVNRAGGALQALKPCFMMGPLSVAQYLKPGHITFDLIVMDEASQLKPEEALGAIARGKQVVIVGDSKQLPPTSFFNRIFTEDDNSEDENTTAIEESESILDIASTLYQPIRRLRWHYRSRHSSLIAFSNKEFYDGNLVVFPSPTFDSPTLGVKFEYVPNGIFENQCNIIEAKCIVDSILNHMREHSDESLGVVALNAKQREFIENEFDQRIKNDPFAQNYLNKSASSLEPFFVKNLENVQGDERDVIFISVTYGKAPTGKLSQNFGPINKATGHRRLNVLFTRAKNRVVVFSSIDPDDLRVEASSPWGIRALKSYLTYAKTGTLEQPKDTTRPPDSDFEIVVAKALRERGYEVAPQVGTAGYFIDIAVRHPKKAGAYILAIECDGATYHSGRSARDRDRLRQAVLENLGWKIHRIWSTDWFKNPNSETIKILNRIESILQEEAGRDALRLMEDKENLEDENRTYHESNSSTIQLEFVQTLQTEKSIPVADVSESMSKRSILTIEEAQELRKKLIDLRENVIKVEFSNADPATGLLRKSVLEDLLAVRPTTMDEWDTQIPKIFREKTDPAQLKYLKQVFEIISDA
jgi:very-short-patch-repair endonuclease